MTAIDTAGRGPAAPTADDDSTPSISVEHGRWKRLTVRFGSAMRTAEPTPERSAGFAVAVATLTLISLTAVWLLIYATFLSGLQERSAQHRLYSSIRASLAQELVPFGGQIRAGTPVAVLSAPEAGITRAVVVQGTTSGELRGGPGHQQDTALPGQAGVSVIMGRSVTFGAPFRHITSLHSGDAVTVTTGQGLFHYTVSDVRSSGDLLPPPLAATAGRLTLVTAHGAGWRDGWAPNTTVFVDATLQGKTVATPPGQPTTIPADETEMKSDTGGLLYLVLWLQALLLVAGAAVWARHRWGIWQTWLAGAPAIAAVAWLASSEAMRLLPNLV